MKLHPFTGTNLPGPGDMGTPPGYYADEREPRGYSETLVIGSKPHTVENVRDCLGEQQIELSDGARVLVAIRDAKTARALADMLYSAADALEYDEEHA